MLTQKFRDCIAYIAVYYSDTIFYPYNIPNHIRTPIRGMKNRGYVESYQLPGKKFKSYKLTVAGKRYANTFATKEMDNYK